jgi:hypothetical protein
VLQDDKKKEKVTFTQNLDYKDFEIGDVVGMRCLVDNVRTKKYINEQIDKFCVQCDTSIEKHAHLEANKIDKIFR